MGKTKGFLKVEHELLDNFALRPLEKLIYMLLLRLRDAPRGCCPSYEYLMKQGKAKENASRSFGQVKFIWLHHLEA